MQQLVYIILINFLFIPTKVLKQESISKGKAFTIDLGDANTVEMVWVPKGIFKMGSLKNEPTKYGDELLHEVEITQGYWLSKYEVTQKQWTWFMKSTLQEQRKKQYKEWKIKGIGDSLPMYFISWEDCMKFCKALNVKEKDKLPKGYKFSLPTEAQWEFACKHNSDNNAPLNVVAWYKNNSKNRVHIVGKKRPNALGIYDMRGNLSEWCFDWYDQYKKSKEVDPKGPITGTLKVVRGGSWFGGPSNAKSTTRFKDPPQNGYNSMGLRLALRPIE